MGHVGWAGGRLLLTNIMVGGKLTVLGLSMENRPVEGCARGADGWAAGAKGVCGIR